MRTTTMVIALVLASLLPAAPAVAQSGTYSFSWDADVMGRALDGTIVSARISGRATARLGATATSLTVDFDTPLGPAHVDLARDTLAFASGQLPFDVPAPLGPIVGASGRDVYSTNGVAPAAWSASGGSATAPDTFALRVTMPGSGPAPEYTFVATGTRQELTAWLTAPADGATVSGAVSVGMTSHGGVGTARTLRLAVDGGLVATATVVDGMTATSVVDTATLANGGHTLRLTVQDASGATASDERSVTVANSAAASVTWSLAPNQTASPCRSPRTASRRERSGSTSPSTVSSGATGW